MIWGGGAYLKIAKTNFLLNKTYSKSELFLYCTCREMSAKNQHHPKWTKEHLCAAIEGVKNGAQKRKTAEKYGIPWGTFTDKLSGRRKMGEQPRTVLSKEEEDEI